MKYIFTCNLVLIGLPGCGKTTVGKRLARRFKRPFADTDAMIETLAGKSIPRIFAEDGEAAFRDLEAACVRRAAALCGAVIATGGGAVLREENMRALKQSGVVVYLDRSPSRIIRSANLDGRPLLAVGESKDARLKALYALSRERKPLYRRYADLSVVSHRRPCKTALRLAAWWRCAERGGVCAPGTCMPDMSAPDAGGGVLPNQGRSSSSSSSSLLSPCPRLPLNGVSFELAVIGKPVLHSLSPLIHGGMLSEPGLAGRYTAIEIAPEKLGAWLQSTNCRRLDGFNVTMPHKQAMFRAVDEVDGAALALGAVNTVVRKNGRLYGFNTDGEGFVRACAGAGVSFRGRRVVMIGAGGAARSIAASLSMAGAASLTLCNRTFLRGKALIDMISGIKARCIKWNGATQPAGLEVVSALSKADVLINASPLGMHGSNDFADTGFLDAMPQGTAVCDAVYYPQQTTLLRSAEERGMHTVGGLEMLINQAVFALELFIGSPVDRARAERAARRALCENGVVSCGVPPIEP